MAVEATTLKYFHVNEGAMIQCDSREAGVGAAILQNDKPIAYASRALLDTEQGYAQIEKEMLSVIFGLEKFDQFVMGRHVTVENNHKPLETIVKKLPEKAPKRLQRMLLTTQKYDYTIRYKPDKEMILADTLSCAYHQNLDTFHIWTQVWMIFEDMTWQCPCLVVVCF